MDSLHFTCQPGCTNCCDQEGFVYLSDDDLKRATKFVRMTPNTFEAKYVYRAAHHISLIQISIAGAVANEQRAAYPDQY